VEEVRSDVEALAARAPFGDTRRSGPCVGWSARGLAPAPRDEACDEVLSRIFEVEPLHALRRIPGRTTFAWPADPEVVVKRYTVAPLGDAFHDWRTLGHARSSARREAENLRELAAGGWPVPRVFGWCEEARTFPLVRGARSALWMERVAHRETLRQACERAPRESIERWSTHLAALVARLHDAGWFHRDLYLEHWIVAGDRLVLLDVGRARREAEPRVRWFVKDVAALQHSCPPGVAPRARLRFLAAYLNGRNIVARGSRRDFARAVLAKARRIAAHEPRFVDLGARL
jgi:tRNA A-37 threonylcarbamoyl transferase component Bud32